MTARIANASMIFLRASAAPGQGFAGGTAGQSDRSGAQRGGSGARGLLGRLIDYIRERRRRFAVMNELAELTDRDLADIGLVRSDIPRIFDPDFARRYEQGRYGF
ncbi:MAG: DUF1127 domain-containing protein [Acetobacteraceae bacterium]